MLKTYYKKKWCKYGDNCKYADHAYLCKFAHYAEEKKKIKFKKPLTVLNYCVKSRYNAYNYCIRSQYSSAYHNAKLSKEITIFHNNIVGFSQVLSLITNDDDICYLIMSYIMPCHDKQYIKTLDKCNYCASIFSHEHDQDNNMLIVRYGLILRNNPFYYAEYRKNCNIGPLCYKCALYSIPIRCDVCNLYTNANNMEFNYDFTKDTEMFDLFKKCDHGHSFDEVCVDKIKSKALNICTVCLLDYYDSIMPVDFMCCRQCVLGYMSNITIRFGSIIRKNHYEQ